MKMEVVEDCFVRVHVSNAPGALFVASGTSNRRPRALPRRWVQFGSHSAVEHMIVYWLAPLAGAGLAGALWRVLNAPRRRPRPGPKGARTLRVPASKKSTSGKALALQMAAAAGQNSKAD